jgi:hypothetical protein
MKILSVLTLALITSLTFTSCKKKSTPSNTPAASNWTILGITYNGATTIAVGSNLISQDQTQPASNALYIHFSVLPTTSGTYTIAATADATHCTLSAYVAATPTSYVGTGGTITVTVTGGKITANFTNGIQAISTINNITPINGTLIEQ